MNIKNLLNMDNRAVSPVIGVILMVAITVILAAVIGTFVLGLGDNVNRNASGGVSVDNGGANTNVTVTSLGTETDGLKCTTGGYDDDYKGTQDSSTIYDSSNGYAGVGDTLYNCEDSVVAVGSGNAEDAVVRTLG